METDVLAAGAMVGTSLDGVDVAVVRFDADLREVQRLGFASRPLAHADAARLRAVAGGAPTHAEELSALSFALVADHAEALSEALSDAGVAAEDLAWFGVHGVTLWHAPGEGHGWQLMSGPALAARTGVPVVHDLRSADLALGGQGAPLAPIADRRLRSVDDEDRVILNLGGIANVTALGSTVVAADVGPANLPLDALVRREAPRGPGYDADGALAQRGRVLESLRDTLLGEPWVDAPLPRSFGREQFGDAWVDALIAKSPGATLADRLATLVAVEAEAVAQLLERLGDGWRRAPRRPVRVLVTGGGRRNTALFDALRSALSPAVVDGIEVLGEDADAKEAVDFALLGGLCVRGEFAGLADTSGATHDVVLGSLAPGRRNRPDAPRGPQPTS